MLDALGAVDAARIVCSRPDSPRALDPEAVADAAIDLGVDRERIDVIEDVPDAVECAVDMTPADGQVIVTGSLYVVGAARGLVPASP